MESEGGGELHYSTRRLRTACMEHETGQGQTSERPIQSGAHQRVPEEVGSALEKNPPGNNPAQQEEGGNQTQAGSALRLTSESDFRRHGISGVGTKVMSFEWDPILGLRYFLVESKSIMIDVAKIPPALDVKKWFALWKRHSIIIRNSFWKNEQIETLPLDIQLNNEPCNYNLMEHLEFQAPALSYGDPNNPEDWRKMMDKLKDL